MGTYLVTGGTGTFGKAYIKSIINKAKKVIVFSRDEFKQHEMAKEFTQDNIRFFLGDVRDRDRCRRAFQGVDYVIHAAALKQVPAIEYNPTEAIKTNIDGSVNVVEASIDCGVKKCILLSTDKAVNPVNLYGATKLAAEKVFLAANAYSGNKTKFSAVRYGNVLGSRGSVLPLFLQQNKDCKPFTVTDLKMTRFWITISQAVELVETCLKYTNGGEIFVPKIPSMKIFDMCMAVNDKRDVVETGIRAGEKIHERLLSLDEVEYTADFCGCYVINGTGRPIDIDYSSDLNENWLSKEELRGIINDMGKQNCCGNSKLCKVV